jgi:hypothetical protein
VSGQKRPILYRRGGKKLERDRPNADRGKIFKLSDKAFAKARR